MIRQRDECYVLETFELGEADLIVTLLTRDHGRVRAVARHARRSRRRFGGALEPLTRVRAEWTERESLELQRLESADCLRSFADMQREPELQAACAVLAEIVRTYAHEGQADPATFRLVGAVLGALEQQGDVRSLLRYFEFWILRLHGLLPDLDACAQCAGALGASARAWVVGRRGLCCARCRAAAGGSPIPWTGEDRRAIASLAVHAPTDLPSLGTTAEAGALERLLRGALEGFAERSFRAYRHLPPARPGRPEIAG